MKKISLIFCFTLLLSFLSARTYKSALVELRTAYHEMDFGTNTPDFEAFASAMNGYQQLMIQGKIKNQILSIIDFNLSANQERFWVLDMQNKKTLFHTLVAHGKNSGEEFAKSFSNAEGSFQSSLGFYITGSIYEGKHGNSLKLLGIEKNINDAAFERGIVIHGADYVSKEFIQQYGRLGRSLGCPAVPANICSSLVSTIKNGSCLFIYKKDESYFKTSKLVSPI